MHYLKNKLNIYRREIFLLAVIIITSVIFFSLNQAFFRWSNITSIFSNYAVYGIMALGMTLVISSGHIDVSVGAQLAAVSMITGKIVSEGYVKNPFTIIVVSSILGLLLGLINGFLVAKIRIPAIIVTLGTLNIIRGLLLLIMGSSWISGLPSWFTAIARTNFLNIGFKLTFYVWIFSCIVIYFVMYHTVAGRKILAVGANREGAMRIGIKPSSTYLLVFGIMGLLSGIGALFFTANIGMAQPVSGVGYEMTLIAIVVIGGTSFSGGNISLLGSFLGTVLIGVIENGMVMARIPVYWQELIKGIVILIAILSSFIKRKETHYLKNKTSRKQVGA